MTARWRGDEAWRRVAAGQAEVVSREQLLALGWASGDVDVARRFAGWQTLGRGVFAVHTGAVTSETRLWAAVLLAGDSAALASWSALEAAGIRAHRGPGPAKEHVGLPHARRLRAVPDLCVHRRRRHDDLVHPFATPTRDRIEVAVLDAAEECHAAEEVVDLVLTVLGDRRVRPGDVLAELGRRRAVRWRHELEGILNDAAAGVASVLEREYVRRVHRPHGLPAATFNARERLDGRLVIRDVVYPGLVVELDGAQHRDPRARRADRARDNALLLERGLPTLRFGWYEIVSTPCLVAATVARALGVSLRPCGALGCAA